MAASDERQVLLLFGGVATLLIALGVASVGLMRDQAGELTHMDRSITRGANQLSVAIDRKSMNRQMEALMREGLKIHGIEAEFIDDGADRPAATVLDQKGNVLETLEHFENEEEIQSWIRNLSSPGASPAPSP